MVLQCFTLLVFFLSSSFGHIEFIYTENEVELSCNTNKWQISTKSDSNIDVNCTVKCVPGETLRLNKTQKFCANKESDKVDKKCPLKASSGFFRCVSALDSGFLFPFAPSPNTVTSYIVAPADESITTKSVERSSVELTEGEDLLLNCSFIITEEHDNQDFSVYWIKTIEKNSICVYSYDFEIHYGIKYNHHCNVQQDLLHRFSNQTDNKNTNHNIRISDVTESDAGQYLCVLQKQTNNKEEVKWKIINHVTVVVHKGSEYKEFKYKKSEDKESESKESEEKESEDKESGDKESKDKESEDKESEEKESEEKESGDKESGDKESKDKESEDKESGIIGTGAGFIPLYTIIPILLVVALCVVGFIWKKSKTSPGSKAIELQRNQHGGDVEETVDVECSPYAIGAGEEEMKIVFKQDPSKQENQEKSTGIYSVMKENDLYEGI